MRILMVTPSYYRLMGGIETFTETIVNKLREKGLRADVMTLNRTSAWEPVWEGGVVNTKTGRTIVVPTSKGLQFGLLGKTFVPQKAYLQSNFMPKLSYLGLMREYDILHYQDENDLSLFVLSYFINKPKIFHYPTLPLSLYDLIRREKALCRFALRAVIYHMVNAGYSKDLLVKLGIGEEKVIVFPNAIDLTKYSQVSYKTDERAEKRRILCVCRLNQYKVDAVESTIDSVEEVSKHVSDIEVLVVGGGPEYDRLKRKAERINRRLGREGVKILGEIGDQDEKTQLMKSSDVIVGVSRVALEGMACGKPVIIIGDKFMERNPVAVFAGVPTKANIEELAYYNFAYIRGGEKVTPKMVATEILELLTDERYGQQVGALGREFVKKRYDAGVVVEQLKKVYESMIC